MDLIKFAKEMETVLKAAATESELVSPA